MTSQTVEAISSADGSRSDRPVPSYYALSVGDIDVVVISDGVLPMSAESLATNADPDVRAAWLDNMFLPADSLALPLNQVVLRRGDQTILIDAGVGDDYHDFTPRAGHWGERVEAAGIDLGSVTDIVLTHMHFDHVGGLLVEGVKDQLRPDVRIHASAAEAEFWESPDFSHTNVNETMQDALRTSASRFLDQYRGFLRPFETEYEVAPGVLARRTGGHTPGHSIVRLASGGDRLTFAGDAVLQAGFDHPDWFNGFEHDPEEAARVRVRLLQELSSTREALVATHLPFPSVCHVATAGNAFRAVPAVWES
ncbi:MBL fold metallo-hydrolase [Mycolicibacterium sp. CBMA 226]|uniref:MBL fold metallo-hydrolase n=1 Tax=Mycolicibacterium sp. CBMA 226 TaxID=2606611 RepID=UPI001FB7B045|nr:MBL fold metallo-hydrolase [Mycolicibacterium sp. CBMA 226]